MQKVFALFLLGVGSTTLAAADPHNLQVWAAGAGVIGAALLWLGRIVWRASAERQKMLDKVCRQADRLENMSVTWSSELEHVTEAVEKVSSNTVEKLDELRRDVSRRLDNHDGSLATLIERVAERNGRCQGRARTYQAMEKHLANAGD